MKTISINDSELLHLRCRAMQWMNGKGGSLLQFNLIEKSRSLISEKGQHARAPQAGAARRSETQRADVQYCFPGLI